MLLSAIAPIVTLIIALGSGFAWWVKRRDAQKDPIPRTAAELALAKEALGIVEASRDALGQDVARLREDLETRNLHIDGLTSKVDTLTGQVDTLSREVHTIREMWSLWYHDLVTRWTHHRAQSTPPAPPVNHSM